MYLKELRTLENVSPIDATQKVLSDLHVAQECEQKKIVEQIAEQTHHLDNFKSSYQILTDDLQQSQFITKSAEGAITSARAAIVKVQALIRDNLRQRAKTCNEKKRAEELEAAIDQVQQELNVRSSQLEILQAQLAKKKLLSDEQLRV